MDAQARSKTSLPLFIISFSILLLLLLTVTKTQAQTTNIYDIATSHCDGTLYPDLCISTLATVPQLHQKTLPQVICSLINFTESAVRSSSSKLSSLLLNRTAKLDPMQPIALNDCLELLVDTMDDLKRATSDLDKEPGRKLDDLRTVLSAAITDQYTCLDGFAHVKRSCNLRPAIEGRLHNLTHMVSNSLAMAKKIHATKKTKSEEEVFEEYGRVVKGFPQWISTSDRQLLKDNVTVADIVVAKDGSGNFTTIMEAVNATPSHSTTRFVIYIKAGEYLENVEVVKKKTNLMFVGDGIEKTVVKAARSVVGGWTTYRSATVAIAGTGFIARDLTIENSAGPSQHQAVALRSNADFSAFYRCSFVGYQDTLYAHSFRQFYRECDVYGTVDFIFGNAAVVFQNCNLYARKPMENQKNMYTAQGREDPNQNTGISIHNCKLAAASDLAPVQSQFKSYLGRPWKMYSRTVIMGSYIDGVVDPAGWLEWDGNFALDTLYYAEYKNSGPGSDTSRRVKWAGFRVLNSSMEASKFTVGQFIQGDEWLAQVPFTSGLA